jgi:hypothetical protein
MVILRAVKNISESPRSARNDGESKYPPYDSLATTHRSPTSYIFLKYGLCNVNAVTLPLNVILTVQ